MTCDSLRGHGAPTDWLQFITFFLAVPTGLTPGLGPAVLLETGRDGGDGGIFFRTSARLAGEGRFDRLVATGVRFGEGARAAVNTLPMPRIHLVHVIVIIVGFGFHGAHGGSGGLHCQSGIGGRARFRR